MSEIRYTYDKAGNRITVEKNEDTVRAYLEEYAHDGADRLTSRRVSGNKENPALNGTTSYTYDENGNLIQEIGPDERVTTYAYDVENRLKAVTEGDRLLMAALYDGDGNRVFRMEYGDKTGGSSMGGAEKEENTTSITGETKGEAGRSGSPLIPHVLETEDEREEVTETRNDIFWYGFGQGLIQGLTTVPGYLGRWLHEHWEYVLRRVDVHRDYEVHTFAEGGDEARKPREGDAFTSSLYEEILIPYKVGEAARESYVETSYVNDVNRAYVETLMEYQINGSGNVYEYGLQRLSYTDMEGGEPFTYLYDGRGSVSNLTSQTGSSVLSYVYDAYGIPTVHGGADSNNPAPGTGNPYGYNGEYTDPATGFQYLRSRYYNGRTGSFLTEDGYGGNVLEPLSQNRYTYTGNNPLNLKDPGGHAWVSGILGKVKSAVSKSTSAKPGVVKSGAAAVAKEKIKKIVTSTRNTASTNSQKSKGTSRQNTGGDIKNAAAKQRKAVTSSSKGAGSSSAKKGWESAILGGISGKVASVVRRLTPGHAYVNNKLLTAISEKERKLCSGAGRILKDAVTAAAGLAKGINRAIMDIWNGSMSVNPMGRLFLKEGKRIVPTVGNTVMEIAKRVIKEQEEERKQEEMRKKQEAIAESRYDLWHMEDSITEEVATKEKIEELTQIYGQKEYENREELVVSPLVNLTARIIYGEQTSAGEPQDIVAWTIINRVLSQSKEHTGNREVTLYNVLTTPSQYTVLDKEQNNTLSFDKKEPGTGEWAGWQHAFELAYWMNEILGDVGENTTQEELDDARRKLEEAIGKSPIGTGRFFRAESDFNAKLLIKKENGEDVYYYAGDRIKSNFVPRNGNVFFEYSD